MNFSHPPKNRALIGLGNVGPQWDMSPHNVGFAVLDKMAHDAGVAFQSGVMRDAVVAIIESGDRQVWLVKPTTGMNDSGRAFAELMAEKGFDFPQVMLVFDDLSLDWGRLRFKASGSAAGHRGVASVLQSAVNERTLAMLKVGIGPDPGGANRFQYVTSPVSPAVTDLYNAVVREAAKASSHWVENGFDSAARTFNNVEVKVG